MWIYFYRFIANYFKISIVLFAEINFNNKPISEEVWIEFPWSRLMSNHDKIRANRQQNIIYKCDIYALHDRIVNFPDIYCIPIIMYQHRFGIYYLVTSMTDSIHYIEHVKCFKLLSSHGYHLVDVRLYTVVGLPIIVQHSWKWCTLCQNFYTIFWSAHHGFNHLHQTK